MKFRHSLILIKPMLFIYLYHTFSPSVLLKDIYSLLYYNSENKLLREDFSQYRSRITLLTK
jgi:hypothetical protein